MSEYEQLRNKMVKEIEDKCRLLGSPLCDLQRVCVYGEISISLLELFAKEHMEHALIGGDDE